MTSRQLQFYITVESPCSYFDDRQSRNLVPDPDVSLNMPVYNQLIQHGFRRSGSYCYRPYCRSCELCVACRIPVRRFSPNRSQRRCLTRNSDTSVQVVPASFNEEYFDLYSRYLNSRHEDSSMACPSESDFRDFLYSSWSDTRFLEIREGKGGHGQLLAVAVTDRMRDGLSAVYSFFDPEMSPRSLGNLCVLKQVELARETGLDFVYLGYWIDGHEKMHYKTRYQPLEIYRGEHWQPYTPL